MSKELVSRIARKSLLSKVCRPEDLMKHFKNGMAIGFSGFTPVGYPKVVPVKLAEYVEKNKLQGKMAFSLFVGASTGQEVEDRWAANGMIARRFPYQTGKKIGRSINTGKTHFSDIHLGIFGLDVNAGFFTRDKGGKMDIAIIEASEILADGSIVLTGAVGIAPEVIKKADKVIVEINTGMPSFKGIHDILENEMPPFRKPFMIMKTGDRPGELGVRCDPEKIVGIVESKILDNGRPLPPPDKVSRQIAGHLMDFFEQEVKAGRLTRSLLPLQSGVGGIANAVTAGFATSNFKNCTVWTEVLQDTMLDFFDSGKLDYASTTSLSFSVPGFKRFLKKFDFYKNKIVIRPQFITNHAEMIRRLGIIGMNTPVEIDIYGHANSTLIGGTKMINGIGGSGDFLRNSHLTIMHTPSVRKTKTDKTGISCIVPKVTHVDHTEHDLKVVVTEQGLADLRGLSPKERAKLIIDKCAHPDYKPLLRDYLKQATEKCIKKGAGHEPHMLDRVFKMTTNLEKNGTMKIDKW